VGWDRLVRNAVEGSGWKCRIGNGYYDLVKEVGLQFGGAVLGDGLPSGGVGDVVG